MGLRGADRYSRKWLSEALRQANKIIGIEQQTIPSQTRRIEQLTKALSEANDLIAQLEIENAELSEENLRLRVEK